jgi:predicted transcriptional regulator
MLNEEVRNIMTKKPVVVHPDDSIQELFKKMESFKLQQVPVVDDENHFLGLITTYDLWRNSSGPSDDKKVKDVMATKVIQIMPKDKVGTAAELFMDKRFKTLPVVNLRNELKGVVTAFDVIRHTLKKEYPHAILYSDIINEGS